jgi:hypothetical protein
MMLSEAGVINLVILNVRDKMNAYQKKKWAGLTPTGLQDDIHDTLSRVASPEWARYMAAHEDLKLLNTKGRDYDNMIGERVVVTYNEQDAEGYEVQVDYMAKVMDLDPFCMIVQYELVRSSGVFDGDIYEVCDKDDWEWA